jgi:hypothetical protein
MDSPESRAGRPIPGQKRLHGNSAIFTSLDIRICARRWLDASSKESMRRQKQDGSRTATYAALDYGLNRIDTVLSLDPVLRNNLRNMGACSK